MTQITQEYIQEKINEVKAANPGASIFYMHKTYNQGTEAEPYDDILIIYREMNRLEYQQSRIANEQGGMPLILAEDALARSVTLYPDKPTLESLLAKHQALPMAIANAAFNASMGGVTVERKKG